MAETIDWPPPRRAKRRGTLLVVAIVAALLFGGGTALSYYVDALWFESLGYAAVFWKTLDLQAFVFTAFAAITFVVLYGAYLALKPPQLAALAGGAILINGQPLRLPVEPVLRLIAIGISVIIALASGAGLMAEWPVLALYWYASKPDALQRAAAAAATVDPILGRPVSFYLFTLPAWELLTGWLLTITIVVFALAAFFLVVSGGSRILAGRHAAPTRSAWRGVSFAAAAMLLAIASRVYLSRFDRLFEDHVIFTGVNYTDAHLVLPGLTVVSIALVVGAAIALVNGISTLRFRWLVAAILPAAVCYGFVVLASWYMTSFIVKPNELVREQPYIAHNIDLTREAYGLNRFAGHPFSADTGIEATEPAKNQATLQNIRLWDWRALQDTLRQIQEIRTYYDFPDIDIDRYEIDGSERQMMLAARELNVDRLPEGSRNWINEKLIYTHGYGVTMNPVNGFTPEGLPQLVLSNMPVQSTIPSISVKRPEIYFGELTDTDVYVKTTQKEFNYPQGQTNSLTSYEGNGGITIGGWVRRVLIAIDRGDLTKLPFSDSVTSDSRLLMRRNIRARVVALAPFLAFDPDPYIVVTDEGRLVWMIDGFTRSDSYPYSRHYPLGRESVNYMRNSVKAVVDAYDGTTTFYVFDNEDPIVAAYREIFPTLFRDSSAMPASLRRHVRYPELLLELQAAVYGLYHMTEPEVFYNREDLWTVASEVSTQGGQAAPMEPNFILMTLPGEQAIEFVEMLPFTPANRNNLIGWIAGRSDGEHYGNVIVFDFPKTKLVEGPLQVEARIDQNPQLSAQLSLWNQQGSHVRRGGLLVIPIGRGLLYAEPIYLQADRSPMPELRLVVLALQDRLAYGPTFDSALAALYGNAPPSTSVAAGPPGAAPPPPAAKPPASAAPESAVGIDALIAGAARDLADYQRLTAEGRLGEAGQRLEALKSKLDQLAKQRR
jgi:uncharacterized membrane protein (UPF0182 family)